MKNWQIILWLVLFFPVGIYLMFMYSDWKKPVKYGITGFLILLLFVGGVELWSNLFFLGSFIAIIIGLFTVFRSKTRRRGLMTLGLGILVFAATYPMIEAQTAEMERLEQIELEAQAEAERIAEEERLEEIARLEEEKRLKEEQERLEEEKRLKEEIVETIEVVEEYPTQANYDKALKLLDQLETEDRMLAARLDEVLPDVEAYEKKVATAKEAVGQAEKDKERESYHSAFELVAALPVSNKSLTNRLSKLDDEMIEIEEEERIAAEKAAEEERKAAEKAVEEQRIAAEQEAKKRAEAQAQQASSSGSSGSSNSGNSNSSTSNNSGNNSTGSAVQTPPPAQPAPQAPPVTGTYIGNANTGKFHRGSCHHVNRMNESNKVSISSREEAINSGYVACKVCNP